MNNDPQDYMYTAGDGFVNPLGWSIAHVACKYGDVSPSAGLDRSRSFGSTRFEFPLQSNAIVVWLHVNDEYFL